MTVSRFVGVYEVCPLSPTTTDQMDCILNQLDTVEEETVGLPQLSFTWSQFSIPPLAEKPQNPIIETLRLDRSKEKDCDIAQDASSADETTSDTQSHDGSEFLELESDAWQQAVSHKGINLETNASWYTSCRSLYAQGTSSFLSQQPPHVLTATRRIIGYAPDAYSAHVTPSELLSCIQSVLTGISSVLYIWDPEARAFHLRDVTGAGNSHIVLSGMDHVVSESLVQRFLTIGTLVRRLDGLVANVWESSSRIEPAIHAFTHAVSSVLDTIKTNTADVTRSTLQDNAEKGLHMLTALWIACASIEEQLKELAGLCGRSMSDHPTEDVLLSQAAAQILSRVYRQLDFQLNANSGREVSAITAFILTATSVDYFDYICRWVGYSEDGIHGSSMVSNCECSTPFDEDETEDKQPDILEEELAFPSFFHESFVQALSRARSSLKLLRVADPDHPVLNHSGPRRRVRWFWADEDIAKAWLGLDGSPITTDLANQDSIALQYAPATVSQDHYRESIVEFERFDLEPGSNIFRQGASARLSHLPNYSDFLRMFPDTLPSLTPCLSNLTELVLAPLASHLEALSTALLDTFLSPSSGHLKFTSQITLLRSFLLLTSPSFKSRLESTLFSNSLDDYDTGVIQHRLSLRRRTSDPHSSVIGLSPELTASSSWPPAGADLSYLLRTVILDALDNEYPSRQLGEWRSSSENNGKEESIYEEAEWRLGFAVRALPTGSGQGRWLNPRSVEALDFLYMNYHPPPALGVLISPNTLSKYHRLFVFNIRLLRVENVVKALFRMSSPGSNPLFQTITSSQRLFEYFRFMASSFVAALSSYIYDTAIGGNFDAFLSKITKEDKSPASKESPTFPDVFALADGHSDLLDEVLSACLMRSEQKPVGDLLRSVLDVILELGVLMGDLRQGVLEEYQATGPLQDLHATFRKKMMMLVRVLKSLVDKGTMSSSVSFEDMRLQLLSGYNPRGVGVTANLRRFLKYLPLMGGVVVRPLYNHHGRNLRDGQMERPIAKPTRSDSKGNIEAAGVATGLARDLTEMLQIAPAAAAASLLLMILETVEVVLRYIGIHANKSECLRLARRCARMLLDIQSAMHGRWHDAPPSLAENFDKLEGTLLEIHEFMQQQVKLRWHSRMLRKKEIDNQIAEYTAQLADAMSSFQATTLINVHYLVSKQQASEDAGIRKLGSYKQADIETDALSIASAASVVSSLQANSNSDLTSAYLEEAPPTSDCATLASSLLGAHLYGSPHEDPAQWKNGNMTPATYDTSVPEKRLHIEDDAFNTLSTVSMNAKDSTRHVLVGFTSDYRPCHHTELKILGRSRIKEGWWAGTVEAELDGHNWVLKRYNGALEDAREMLRQDIAFLHKIRGHSAFPLVHAISLDTAPTPFVTISQGANNSVIHVIQPILMSSFL
ncbi:Spc98 family-domain-containing protein [Cytidiella melzeri]|nr:Spc98 family-domain-containing protein [Cytidiella melzeri]